MPRKAKGKSATSPRKAPDAKHRSKEARRSAPRKAGSWAPGNETSPAPILSQDVVEEILVHSARFGAGEHLSPRALSQVALAAGLDPATVLGVHKRLCAAADDTEMPTVLRIVEIEDPYE